MEYIENWGDAMPFLGTIIDAVAIIAGGFLGLLFGRRLSERCQETMLKACGLSIFFIGVGGVMAKMLTVSSSGFTTSGTVMMASSLTLGALIGEALDIEKRMVSFGEWLKRKTGSHDENTFVSAFVNASLVVSIGAMAVLGPINEVIAGDESVLFSKSILDLILILLMTLSSGKGAVFSFIPVLLVQGAVTVLASLISPVMTAEAINALSLVGSVLIATLGINMVWEKNIRVSNMFPSVIVAVLWAFIAQAL